MGVKFSIVIPAYNRVELLRLAVESALAQQGFEDYEVVVVDDCSPDGTWDYLRGVENPKLRIFRNDPRLGMGRNWNQAVRRSAGEYVFILQDDDLAMPNLLARASDLIDKYRTVDLACFTTCLINGEGQNRQVFWQPEREQLLRAPQALLYFARHWTLSSTQVIFSRRLFDLYGEFDVTPPIMSDAEAILRWMLHANTLLAPEVVSLRRAWQGSVTSATQRSDAMLETMQYLVSRIHHLAAASDGFECSQLEELDASLQRTFVEPYQKMIEGQSPKGRNRLRAKLKLGESAGK